MAARIARHEHRPIRYFRRDYRAFHCFGAAGVVACDALSLLLRR